VYFSSTVVLFSKPQVPHALLRGNAVLSECSDIPLKVTGMRDGVAQRELRKES
jgi:hypothetical protein